MTPIKRSPLHAWSHAHGARLGEAAGWLRAEAYAALEAELAAARQHAALADVSSLGKVQVEGDAAAAVIHAASGDAYALRPDLYLLLTPPGGEDAALAGLAAAQAAQSSLVTLTDLTHGLAGLSLIGPRARELLRRVCALDLSPTAFPDQTARPTSVARTRQIVVRRDLGALPAFILLGAPSLTAYLWETLLEAGRPLGITPIGSAALDGLHTPMPG